GRSLARHSFDQCRLCRGGRARVDRSASVGRARSRTSRNGERNAAGCQHARGGTAVSVALWQPSPERIARSNLTRFTHFASNETGRVFADYAALHQFSVREAGRFWELVWDFAGVTGERGERAVVDADRMPGARFFPAATLNFA